MRFGLFFINVVRLIRISKIFNIYNSAKSAHTPRIYFYMSLRSLKTLGSLTPRDKASANTPKGFYGRVSFYTWSTSHRGLLIYLGRAVYLLAALCFASVFCAQFSPLCTNFNYAAASLNAVTRLSVLPGFSNSQTIISSLVVLRDTTSVFLGL